MANRPRPLDWWYVGSLLLLVISVLGLIYLGWEAYFVAARWLNRRPLWAAATPPDNRGNWYFVVRS